MSESVSPSLRGSGLKSQYAAPVRLPGASPSLRGSGLKLILNMLLSLAMGLPLYEGVD